MNSSYLITRPDHDDTTRYLYHWSAKIIKKAQTLKKKLSDLPGKKASPVEFLKALKKIKPHFLFLNGHGNENVVTGYNNVPLVEKDRNEKLLKKRITYALSCQSAKNLGPSAVNKGAEAYIGYDEDFIFMISENQSDPLKDKIAKLFMEPAIQVPLSLLDGSSPKKAWQKSQDHFSKNIKKNQSSGATKAESEAVFYLQWDKTHQLCLTGND